MNYEKRYKAARARAKEMCATPTDKATMEYIFPELKESKDKRIRKWLEELIEAMPDNSIEFKELKRIDVLHWLEKQREQTHAKLGQSEVTKTSDQELPDDPYGAYFFGGDDKIKIYIREHTDGLWKVDVDEIEIGGIRSWRMYVSNVHELQHAIRLCKIDKEIEL